jgi:superfamily I DNA/RNA helicase
LERKPGAGGANFASIAEVAVRAGTHNPAQMIAALADSAYKDYLQSEYVDSRDRLADINQLCAFAEKYIDLDQFLAEASLQEGFGARSQNQSGEKIVLSTVHQAKGLEWQAVFVINMASGAFPGDRSLQEPGGLEEERRLFYVAITRAKRHLYLTYPMAGGAWGDSMSGPSLFLAEINSDLLDDRSLLSTGNGLMLNDEEAGVSYIDETKPLKIRPGSFLRDLNDL